MGWTLRLASDKKSTESWLALTRENNRGRGYDGGEVGDHADIGGLKGNKGTQQYDLPAGVDTSRYSTVLIWCRACSVAFGAADLAQ